MTEVQPDRGLASADPPESAWITPAEAVAALAKIYGNRSIAKDALADLLLDGEVTARAAKSWFSDKENLTAAWKSRHGGEYDANVTLRARDWMDSEDWFNDLTRWRWLEARFVLTTSEEPREWRFLEGVELRHEDVSKAVDLAVGAVSRSKGGTNADVQRWARFWLAAVESAYEKKLVRTTLRSKSELYRELQKKDPTTFTKRAVDAWIDMLWTQFVNRS